MRHPAKPAIAGRTLVEMTIATTALIGLMAAAVPAFTTITKAGDEGRTRTWVEADNRASLLRVGRELQNTSLTQLNAAGQPVFNLSVDTSADPLWLQRTSHLPGATEGEGPGTGDRTANLGGVRLLSVQTELAEDVALLEDGVGGNADGAFDDELPDAGAWGGPNGDGVASSTPCAACCTGDYRGHTCGLPDGTFYKADTYGSTPLNPQNSGSGRRSYTRSGRTRSQTGSLYTFGNASLRPRNRNFTLNAIVTFQKVIGYWIDTNTNAPVLNWSTPITYRVQGRDLVRQQDGRTLIVSRNCSCFFVEQTDAGTIVLSLISQRRAPSTGEVTQQSNQVEIRPKN
jgi:hypothetical protein